MDDKRTHTPKARLGRSPLTTPMAQQRVENHASPTPQSLVQLIGCHDAAKRRLPGKRADSRPSPSASLTE